MNQPFPHEANSKVGSELTKEDQQYVLAAFVHRFTGEHQPSWTAELMPNGRKYPVQFKDDREWLANSWFRVYNNGRVNRNTCSCWSSPTWPENPELRKT